MIVTVGAKCTIEGFDKVESLEDDQFKTLGHLPFKAQQYMLYAVAALGEDYHQSESDPTQFYHGLWEAGQKTWSPMFHRLVNGSWRILWRLVFEECRLQVEGCGETRRGSTHKPGRPRPPLL